MFEQVVPQECLKSPFLPAQLTARDIRNIHATVHEQGKSDRTSELEGADACRWSQFLDWLSAQGLLTTAVQSRSPQDGQSASLDDIRGGSAGDPILRSAIDAGSLFTNAFLPSSL